MIFSSAFAYAKHRWQAKSRYRVHSPFVFEFYQTILPHRSSEWGETVENLRKSLVRDSNRSIEYEDHGAGAGKAAFSRKTVKLSRLAKKSARRRREGELLYRICQYYQPRSCLEFGSNLGISTLYQAGALTNSRFISLEGSPELAQIAQAHCDSLEVKAKIETGEFSQLLEEKIPLELLQPDYVFIDGNHRYAPTLEYFERLLPHMAAGGIMIFDDINWSGGMQKAWREIVSHPQVSISLDLFWLGICFVKRSQAKEHFMVPFRAF